MPETALPVEYLFTLKAQTSNSQLIPDGPAGTRVIFGVPGGTFEGPKLRGTIVSDAAGDWVTMRKDGSFKLDVRLTLLTDDGATILMTYFGIGVRQPGGAAIRTAPLFETGDINYDWLNRVQAIGVGTPGDDSVEYDVYALVV